VRFRSYFGGTLPETVSAALPGRLRLQMRRLVILQAQPRLLTPGTRILARFPQVHVLRAPDALPERHERGHGLEIILPKRVVLFS
jgi:hypothetical protein